MVDWTSPRLGVRFRQEGEQVGLFYPDGSPFQSFEALLAEWNAEKQRADRAEAELTRLRKQLEEGDD